MARTIPDRLPRLSAGKQPPGSNAVCAMQAINWIVSGRENLGDETDRPPCVQPILRKLVTVINDWWLPDDRRDGLWPLIVRLPGTARPDMEPYLSVRIAVFCAEQAYDYATRATTRASDPSNAACYIATCAAQSASQAATYVARAAELWNDHDNAVEQARLAIYLVLTSINDATNALRLVGEAAPSEKAFLELLDDAITLCEQETDHNPYPIDAARIEQLGKIVGTY
jgi:hypothetical protein